MVGVAKAAEKNGKLDGWSQTRSAMQWKTGFADSAKLRYHQSSTSELSNCKRRRETQDGQDKREREGRLGSGSYGTRLNLDNDNYYLSTLGRFGLV